jgi:hypothetical protein
VNSSFPRLPGILLVTTWILALTTLLIWPEGFGSWNPGDGRVRLTIRLSLSWWLIAVLLMPSLNFLGWQARGWGRLVRWAWTLGWLTLLIHIGLAFHHSFGWSHDAALAHTRTRSGLAEGIYVSYAFTLAWGADVAWWWLAPFTYARRSPWWDRILHGFLTFIIFNGTVVYETGVIRWVGAAAFALLAVLIIRSVLRYPLFIKPHRTQQLITTDSTIGRDNLQQVLKTRQE